MLNTSIMFETRTSNDSSKTRHFRDRTFLFLYAIVMLGSISTPSDAEVWPCDPARAEGCVVQLKEHIKAISQSIQNLDIVDKTDIGILCIQSVLGSNFNECYLNATANCPHISAKLESDWELVQNNVFKLCEKVCPGFVVRIMNVSRCTAKMRQDPALMRNFDLFCDAMNTTIQCVSNEADGCDFYPHIVRSLLPRDAEAFSISVCREECRTIDSSLNKLSGCQKHMDAILANMDCTSMGTFKQCLFESGVPGCPILESVVNATYPYHIYGPLETMCNGSEVSHQTPDADCQRVMPHGHSEIRDCMETILLSANRFETMEEKHIRETDCLQYDEAKQCIDNSGAVKCKLLANYLKQLKHSHSTYFGQLQKQCFHLNKTVQTTTEDLTPSSMAINEGSHWLIILLLMTSISCHVFAC